MCKLFDQLPHVTSQESSVFGSLFVFKGSINPELKNTVHDHLIWNEFLLILQKSLTDSFKIFNVHESWYYSVAVYWCYTLSTVLPA